MRPKKLRQWIVGLFDTKPDVFYVEYAPTIGGGHTSYNLLRPRGQLEVHPWPRDNFLLTTEENQASDQTFLEQYGFRLTHTPS